MHTHSFQLQFWAPRILGLAFAAFISLFALDVFGEGLGFWQTLLALFLHLVPTFLVLGLLALAWRWDWLGVVLFPALAVFYLVIAWGRFPWSTYLIISGPLTLLGLLFLFSWRHRHHHHPRGGVAH